MLPLLPLADVTAELAQFDACLAQIDELLAQPWQRMGELLLTDPGLEPPVVPGGYAAWPAAAAGCADLGGALGREAFARRQGARGNSLPRLASGEKLCATAASPFDAIERLLQWPRRCCRRSSCACSGTLLAEAAAGISSANCRAPQAGAPATVVRRSADAGVADTRTGRRPHFNQFVRSRYRAAPIDEFQDTDPVCSAAFCGAIWRHRLAAVFVGDPKPGHLQLPRRRHPRLSGSAAQASIAARRWIPISSSALLIRRSRCSAMATIRRHLSIPVSIPAGAGAAKAAAVVADRRQGRCATAVLLPAEIGKKRKKPPQRRLLPMHWLQRHCQRNRPAADAGGAGQAYIDEQGRQRRLSSGDIRRCWCRAAGWHSKYRWAAPRHCQRAPGARQRFASAEAQAYCWCCRQSQRPAQGLVRALRWWRRCSAMTSIRCKQAMDAGEPWGRLLDEFSAAGINCGAMPVSRACCATGRLARRRGQSDAVQRLLALIRQRTAPDQSAASGRTAACSKAACASASSRC